MVIALNILFYLLLASAAVETFWYRSPIRWYVVAIVVLYFGASAALWRFRPSLWHRLDWGTKAMLSFFVLLVLLALTAWLPGGLVNGIKLFALSTSTLLSLVTAAAVALAGLILFRVEYPHPALKWAIAALMAYGVCAFLGGVYSGTNYPVLVSGHSFWSRLPRVLQGAFIGAVLIATALVYEIVAVLRRSRVVAFDNWGFRQVVALGLSFIMVTSGFTTSASFRSPQSSAAEITASVKKSYQELTEAIASGRQGTDKDPKQIAKRLEKVFQLMEEAERQIPRDTFDIQAVLQKVGSDPVKLFQWARDETYLVPYRGALRGATGVLMDRLGNSLDRSLLLSALLSSAGYRVRLARAALNERQAKEVLERARPIPKDGVPALKPAREVPDDLLRKIAAQNQLDPARLRTHMTNLTADQERMKDAVQSRVAEQAAFIAAAVGKPKEDIRKKEEAADVESLRDHWWVQRQDGSGWVNLDPTLPDAQPGRTLLDAQQTAAPDKLPKDLYHEVEIRIVIEQWRQGNLKEAQALNQTLRPMELFGQHITLRHMPLHWPKAFDPFNAKDPVEALTKTALEQNEWLPVLSVGDKATFKSAFTDSGDTRDGNAALTAAGWGFTKAAERVTGLFGSGRIGGLGVERRADKPRKTEAVLTAEWIEYEIRVPGQAPRKFRRQIFDLVGPAARSAGTLTTLEMNEARRLERGLTLLGETEILPLIGQLSPEFVQHLAVKNMLVSRDVLLGLAHSSNSTDYKALADAATKLVPVPGSLYGLALARWAWSRFRHDVYLDRLNILSFNKRPRQNTAGELLLRYNFDIVANEVAVNLRSGTDPFLVRLEQGVLDTNAEAILMPRSGKVENTAEMFAGATKQDIEWVTIRKAQNRPWQSIELSPDVRARIEQDLAAGEVVIVPKRAISMGDRTLLGWWRVNQRTGQTLGLGSQGAGQGGTERQLTIAYTTAWIVGILVWLDCTSLTQVTHLSGEKALLCLLCSLIAAAGAAAAVYVALVTGLFWGSLRAPIAQQTSVGAVLAGLGGEMGCILVDILME